MISKCKEWILRKSTIDKEFIFNGGLDEFLNLLNPTYCKYMFQVTKLEKENFEITAKSSLGIMIVNGNAVNGINVFGTIQSINSETLSIRMKTKIRAELYICFLIIIFCLILMFKNFGEVPFWPFLFSFLPILWFNWLYMIQNKELIDDIVKYLDLKSTMPEKNK